MTSSARWSFSAASVWPTVIRVVVGGMFVLAGVLKIMRPADFLFDLHGYEVPMPDLFLRLVAVALPWFEVLCGLGLLFDFWAETVRPVVAVLCAVFVVMLGQALLRGLDLECGCFGSLTPAWASRADVALVRALLLLVAALYLVGRNGRGRREGR